MTAFALREIATCTDGRLVGADLPIRAVGTDTRTLQGGELFVALRGPNFDGHDFVTRAQQGGAGAALVECRVDSSLPQVLVDDTRLGLGRLARAWRDRANPFVLGVTGSNGKTTLKEMIAAILSQRGRVLATRGNLNNAIGLPLTLTRLQGEAYAVIELGASQAGEIDYLARIARPDVAVLNNAGRAHLEGFGSLQGVALAKAEILNGLEPDGVFVYNADDAFASLWADLAARYRTLTFGMHSGADVRSDPEAARIDWQPDGFRVAFEVTGPQGRIDLRMRIAGEHNRMNALAAVAASQCAGASDQNVIEGLAGLRPVPGRLCPVPGINGSLLIDDSYNANPESVLAAIRLLHTAPGERFLVLGDLAELGSEAAALHAGLGRAARREGIDRLYGCGPLSAQACAAFGAGARHFTDRDALAEALAPGLGSGQVVLVKGSRAAGMEGVIRTLSQEKAAC